MRAGGVPSRWPSQVSGKAALQRWPGRYARAHGNAGGFARRRNRDARGWLIDEIVHGPDFRDMAATLAETGRPAPARTGELPAVLQRECCNLQTVSTALQAHCWSPTKTSSRAAVPGLAWSSSRRKSTRNRDGCFAHDLGIGEHDGAARWARLVSASGCPPAPGARSRSTWPASRSVRGLTWLAPSARATLTRPAAAARAGPS